jgi:hypothetical protein
MYAHIDTNLFIGSPDVLPIIRSNHQLGITGGDLSCISLIVNVSSGPIDPIPGIIIREYVLDSDELMPEEYSMFHERVSAIISDIKTYMDGGHEIMILCDTGKDQSALIATCWRCQLLNRVDEQIKFIKNVYLNDTEKARYVELGQEFGECVRKGTLYLFNNAAEFNSLKSRTCLKMKSYVGFVKNMYGV